MISSSMVWRHRSCLYCVHSYFTINSFYLRDTGTFLAVLLAGVLQSIANLFSPQIDEVLVVNQLILPTDSCKFSQHCSCLHSVIAYHYYVLRPIVSGSVRVIVCHA